MKFRAAVFAEPGRPMTVETAWFDHLAPHDVLVRNQASGLCHTDLEVIAGQLSFPLPIVLGHETAGIVEAVGKSVTRVAPGDHVVLSWNPHCGRCFYCERDLPILCEPCVANQRAGKLPDGTTRLRYESGALHHFACVSGYAEYSVIPESGAIAISRQMPFDRACLLGCAVMTGFGAVCRLACVEPGSSVAVVGCGPVGLNAIQAARFMRCERIIAIDRDPARLALAARLGASESIGNPYEAPERVRALTAGRGADYVFEAAGAEAALQTALDVTRPGGQLVVLGKVDASKSVSLRFGSLMGEKRIVRSSYGGARPHRDFPWLAELYLRGELLLDELISSRLPLAALNDGIAKMSRGEGIRHVLLFDEAAAG